MFAGQVSKQDKEVLSKLVRLICDQRRYQLQTATFTILLWKSPTGWKNLLTKVNFLRKGAAKLPMREADYGDIYVFHTSDDYEVAAHFIEVLVTEGKFDGGGKLGQVEMEGRFVYGTPQPRERTSAWREWSEWPADVFMFEAQGESQMNPPGGPFISLDAPYYPHLGDLLASEFGLRDSGGNNYARGLVVVAVPDFTARVSRLSIGPRYLSGEIECPFAEPNSLALKVYAESNGRVLARDTILLEGVSFKLDFEEVPTAGSIVLLSKQTRETLDLRSFNRNWAEQQDGIAFEGASVEIRQMLLSGEGETIEFRSNLKAHNRFVATVVAFANTQGGTIIFGVSDNLTIQGCNDQESELTAINLIRSWCDPIPGYSIEAVDYEQTRLLVLKIRPLKDAVCLYRDHGVFIRAGSSNRVPTSFEHARLAKERLGT